MTMTFRFVYDRMVMNKKGVIVKRVAIMLSLLLSGVVGQALAESDQVAHGEALYQPMATLRSCTRTEPKGYLWVGGSYNPSCQSVSGNNWAYQFESYFDKPIGFWMPICSDESIVPDGWFVVSHTQFTGCADGRNFVPVIRRYS
jgi:hypothetical protein